MTNKEIIWIFVTKKLFYRRTGSYRFPSLGSHKILDNKFYDKIILWITEYFGLNFKTVRVFFFLQEHWVKNKNTNDKNKKTALLTEIYRNILFIFVISSKRNKKRKLYSFKLRKCFNLKARSKQNLRRIDEL